MTAMRASRVLRKLRNGELVLCFKINLADARAVEIAALAGFDCVWCDQEHVANDWSVLEQQIWAAKAYDVDVMARVSRGGYSDYTRPLELDAAGIMVPHTMGIEDAERVVKITRFHPIGRRPLDGGNADGAYCAISIGDYVAQANEQRFVTVQIEDPEPLDDLDAIAALPGIDMLFFGALDFSHGIGAPGEIDHPEVIEARRRVAEAAGAHGKFAGTVGNANTLPDLFDQGYRFISSGADVFGLGQYCQQIKSSFDDAPGK